MRVVLSPFVKSDPEQIADWIAQDNPSRAITFICQIRDKFRVIGQGPLLYQVRPDIGEDARIATVGQYVILFRIDGDVVRIERVIFGARDLPALR